jgi:cell division protein FtsA
MAKGKTIAAIDIGTEKVCTIIANQSEELDRLTVVGVASTPSRGLRKSQIVDLEEAIQAITISVEAAERMAGDSISTAYISISGSHIASQNSKGVVAVAEPEGEISSSDISRVIEAARAVSLPSARDIIHVIPRDFTVDSQGGIKDPIGMTGVRLEAEAHLVTASSTAIKNAVKCMSEVGIDVQGIIFSGIASSHAVLSDTEKELGVISVDIGGGSTSVTVYIEGSIAYSAVIPVGARNITNDLAIGMRLSLASAEKVKLFLSKNQKESTGPSPVRTADIAKLKKEQDTIDLSKLGITEETSTASQKALIEGIIRPRLNELFTMISDHVKNAGLVGQTPAGIVITGGGADTVAIVDTAKRVLSLPARVGIPKGLSGLVDELSAPAFATATGLIMHATKSKDEAMVTTAKKPKVSLKLFSENHLDNLYKKLIDLVKSFLP